jgi:hypothetical protein
MARVLHLFPKGAESPFPILPRSWPEAPPSFLILELPTFTIPIVHEEAVYPNSSQAHILDYEQEGDNPSEDKYRTLAHDLLRGMVDPALKPDREQRARLAAIIASPSHHPTREEQGK